MTERDWILRWTRDLPIGPEVVVGPGDDCAVLDAGIPDHWLLFKTDAVVEGIHFTPDTEPARVGHKAIARCLSDIAAMGGKPSSALVTVAVPPANAQRIDALYAGLTATARRHGVSVVGGETTATPGPLLISVALLGQVEKDRCVRRRGAQPGDALFVTGDLGGSLAGRHLDFEPRLEPARWLTDRFRLTAMIDLSDGLATDLRHLTEAGAVGAEILAHAIPISRAARQQARSGAGRPPLTAALADGEDFELCFTLAGRDAVPLLDAWKQQFPHLRLSCIGRIVASPGITLIDRSGRRPLTSHGYDHFPSPG